MMDKDKGFGFLEIQHTADWALRVWAPDIPGLFQQAALGMYSLIEVELLPGDEVERRIQLSAGDPESLLVAFLDELLFLVEQERMAFDRFDLGFPLRENDLIGEMRGRLISGQRKEIKAVTYHDLQIRRSDAGYETTIVFDV
jgi:SHS2 domain-containing protein